jgi:hypothetical protein
MSPEVLIRVLFVDLKDPRRKKEGNLYAGDRGHFTPDRLDTRISGANILIITQAD